MRTSARTRYAGYRFPAAIIGHAVWLYFRFPLGLRMVEGLLAARGIIVSHETVRQWARKFGPAVCQPDPSPPSAGWRQMAFRRGRAQNCRGKALALASRGPGRRRARRPGPTPTQQASRQAAPAQTAEEADAAAPCHDHRQACQLRRGKE